jgi:hypothetical protein
VAEVRIDTVVRWYDRASTTAAPSVFIAIVIGLRLVRTDNGQPRCGRAG